MSPFNHIDRRQSGGYGEALYASNHPPRYLSLSSADSGISASTRRPPRPLSGVSAVVVRGPTAASTVHPSRLRTSVRMTRASEHQRDYLRVRNGSVFGETEAPWNPNAMHAVAQGRALSYGIGLRVLWDRRLLEQIRDDVCTQVTPISTIAKLENVSSDQLTRLLETVESTEGESAALRRLADRQSGYSTAAWRTSRKRLSKRHVVNEHGQTLCGTPVGNEQEVLDSGPCFTCAARIGIGIETDTPA